MYIGILRINRFKVVCFEFDEDIATTTTSVSRSGQLHAKQGFSLSARGVTCVSNLVNQEKT